MSKFENIIKDYIEGVCKTDEVLAGKYEKSGKDIEGCCKYIKSQAREKAQNGCAVIEDAEVFGWAVHYFDEEMTAPKEDVACKVETTADPNVVRAKVEIPKPAPKPQPKPKKEKKATDESLMSLFNFDEEDE